MAELSAIDMAQAVDLDKIDCQGCKHRSSQGVCRRYPPIFKPSMPAMVNGTAQLVPGGWAFPPAVQKCGEFEDARILQ